MRHPPLSLSLGCLLAACSGKETDSGDTTLYEPRTVAERTPEIAAVADGNNAFAWDLHERLRESTENLVTSPISVSTALSMAYAGARGATATEMADVLHVTLADSTWHASLGALVQDLGGVHPGRSYTLYLANRVWGQTGYPWEPTFLDILSEDYGAPLGEVDFAADPAGAEAEINAWVSDQTQGIIDPILPEDSVTRETRLALANAIYFRAAWVLPFASEMTNPGSFWLADGTEVEATLMRRFDETWWMAEEEGVVSVVRLPYVDDEISMYVVLPETADGLPGIEAGLSPERIQGWIDQIDAEEHHVDGLVLPRFTVSTNLELSGVLASMGMPGAFDASTADFSGVAGDEEPSLHLSKVFHQAWLSVDESGTEAGGATVVISTNGDPVVVKVQHPFLFFVRDDLTHTVLFAGRCADPR